MYPFDEANDTLSGWTTATLPAFVGLTRITFLACPRVVHQVPLCRKYPFQSRSWVLLPRKCIKLRESVVREPTLFSNISSVTEGSSPDTRTCSSGRFNGSCDVRHEASSMSQGSLVSMVQSWMLLWTAAKGAGAQVRRTRALFRYHAKGGALLRHMA